MPFSVTDDFFCHRSRCWIQAVYWNSAQHGGGKAGGKYSIHQSCQRSWQQTTYTHSHTGPYPCRFQLPWRPNQPRSSLPRTLACVDFSVWCIWNFALSHGKHWQTLWFNTGINCSHFKYTTLPFHVSSFQLMSLAVLVSLPSLSEVDSGVARGFPSTLWVGSRSPGGFITIHELGNSITECNNTAMWQGCEETALGWMIWIYRTQMRGVSSIALLSDLLKYPLRMLLVVPLCSSGSGNRDYPCFAIPEQRVAALFSQPMTMDRRTEFSKKGCVRKNTWAKFQKVHAETLYLRGLANYTKL